MPKKKTAHRKATHRVAHKKHEQDYAKWVAVALFAVAVVLIMIYLQNPMAF